MDSLIISATPADFNNRWPRIATAQETVAAMATAELFDMVRALVAAHHGFDQQGALYSGLGDKWSRIHSWADGHCDRLKDELRHAFDELMRRDIADVDEVESRNLALASAYHLVSGSGDGFAVTVSVTANRAGA